MGADEKPAASLRGALSNALCNASNFPPKAATHILGRDMTPLLDATADAILTSSWLADHTASALEDAANRLVHHIPAGEQLRDRAARLRNPETHDSGREDER